MGLEREAVARVGRRPSFGPSIRIALEYQEITDRRGWVENFAHVYGRGAPESLNANHCQINRLWPTARNVFENI
jgi:hypothetical protein